MAQDRKGKGSVGFYVSHSHPDWATNAKRYTFRVVKYGNVRVRATKNPDGMLSVTVTGIFGGSYDFSAPVILLENGLGIHVGVTWQDNEVAFYMNGMPVTSQAAPKTAAAGRLIESWGAFIGRWRSTRFSIP
jgi:hypothetical protein